MQGVSDLFRVLSEPTRLRILQLLQSGPASVGQIVDGLGIKQANASKQLGILHQAGVLARQREGNVVRYEIRMPLVIDLCHVVCGHLRDAAVENARLFQR